MWTQSTSVTDGRTQTDRITMTKTVQHIASHGKICVRGEVDIRGRGRRENGGNSTMVVGG